MALILNDVFADNIMFMSEYTEVYGVGVAQWMNYAIEMGVTKTGLLTSCYACMIAWVKFFSVSQGRGDQNLPHRPKVHNVNNYQRHNVI